LEPSCTIWMRRFAFSSTGNPIRSVGTAVVQKESSFVWWLTSGAESLFACLVYAPRPLPNLSPVNLSHLPLGEPYPQPRHPVPPGFARPRQSAGSVSILFWPIEMSLGGASVSACNHFSSRPQLNVPASKVSTATMARGIKAQAGPAEVESGVKGPVAAAAHGSTDQRFLRSQGNSVLNVQ
jgi:hypothetical protein